MNFTRPTHRSQPVVPSFMDTIHDLDEAVLGFMVISLVATTLASLPFFAFLGLAALTCNRLWPFVRIMARRFLLLNISWVATVTLFLFTGSDIQHMALMMSLAVFGTMRTTLLLLVILTLPFTQILLHIYVLTGFMVALVFLIWQGLDALWRRAHPAYPMGVLVVIAIGYWLLRRAWERFWENGPGVALLTEAEAEWEDEEPLLAILRGEVDEGPEALPDDEREWRENVWNARAW